MHENLYSVTVSCISRRTRSIINNEKICVQIHVSPTVYIVYSRTMKTIGLGYCSPRMELSIVMRINFLIQFHSIR